jgi:hypothetical protein
MSCVCLWSPSWATAGAALAERATALLAHTPRIAMEARGVIWADARGLPAPKLAWTLLRLLQDGGTEAVRAGVSAVPVVAELAARAGELPVAMVESGYEAAFLFPLPLDLLQPDKRLRPLLEGVGLRTCGELAALTREAVEVRLGGEGLALWRLARAEDPRRLFGPIPRERPHTSLDFTDYEVRDAARLLFTANTLLASLCEALRARGERARSLALELSLAGGGTWKKSLRVALPTADRAAWLQRLRNLLEGLVLPDAVRGIALRVEASEPASAVQGDLFDRGFASAGAVEEAAARLLDLQGELFVEPERDPHPLAERRTRWRAQDLARIARTSTSVSSSSSESLSTPCLTLQLLPEPRRIAVRVRARRDHQLPLRYLDRGRWHELQAAAGPDRVSGGQWEERPYAREDAWYLHGWWD